MVYLTPSPFQWFVWYSFNFFFQKEELAALPDTERDEMLIFLNELKNTNNKALEISAPVVTGTFFFEANKKEQLSDLRQLRREPFD